ncbi:MAG TPA: GNAT family N-acetyltransferase [Kofleriaceae bacterium]|nr:GNAT family N-acetyltransferase [Kofleriaceae bacterium]
MSTSRFITRDARREDYAAFVGFWGELGLDQAAPDVEWWLEHLAPRTRFLAEPESGKLVAYSLTFAFGERGDVRQIAVDPSVRRQGVGRALFAAIAERFRGEGVRDWRLEVKQDNVAGIALYRAVGMDVIRELLSLRMTAEQVRAFAATRLGGSRVDTVEPADDAALEARWDLGRGQIARWRKARGPNARLMRIADRALAQFTPDFSAKWGLVFPLYAIDRGHVAAIFGAMTQMELPPIVEMQIPDGVAAKALERAGAKVLERLYEMGGVLDTQ